MKIVKSILTMALLSMCFVVHAAQKPEDGIAGKQDFRLRFIINVAEFDSTYAVNKTYLRNLHNFLGRLANDTLTDITRVEFYGSASPDGSYEFNQWLSKERLKTFTNLMRSYVDIPDSVIFSMSSDVPWSEFRNRIVEDLNVPMRSRVLEIIDEGETLVPYPGNRHIDQRLLKIKELQGGRVWDYLKNPILADLRYGNAVFYYQKRLPAYAGPLALDTAAFVSVPASLYIPPVERVQYDTVSWTPRIYLKTNLIGWALASANLGVEFDLAPHWSLTLPAYYSAVDYFKSTIKFRNITFQPELRYWPNAKEENHGFFIGAHFGMMYYNFAVDGKHRFQDHDGKTPALGGGIGIGYRKAISKNKRWHIEFTAGAGVYKLDYDVFENTPNYKDGPLVYRKKKTFIGLDQAAISITYNFPLRKREKIYEKGGEL